MSILKIRLKLFQHCMGGYSVHLRYHQNFPNKQNRKRDAHLFRKMNKGKFDEFPTLMSGEAQKVQVHVVSTGTFGTGCSVLLNTSNRKYLFNCGETTEKILTDNCLNFSNISDIFFTTTSWKNVGGLFGIILTMKDYDLSKKLVRLHSSTHVGKLLGNLKMLVDKYDSPLPRLEWCGLGRKLFKDDQLTVEYVGLHKNKKGCKGFEKIKTENHENESDTNAVMCFIIKLKKNERKFDIHKLMKVKAERGPWIKQLVQGEEVVLDNGQVIKPKDVMSEDDTPNGPIVVIDCPTEDYLDSLVTNKQMLDLQSQDVQPVMMIHMAPADLINDPRYKAFMDRHKTETVHLMMNENSHDPYLHQTSKFHSILNRIHPGIFPALQGYQYNRKVEPTTDNIVQACYSMSYRISPGKSRGFNWDDMQYFDGNESFRHAKNDAVKAALNLVKYTHCEQRARQLMDFKTSDIDDQIYNLKSNLRCRENDISEDKGEQKEYPEVVFLGTGSGRSSLFRNSSSILVQMRKDEYFMMDCGEGTLHQMYQMYGLEKTNHILCNLKALFVSHLHLDHHGGVTGILEARQKEISKYGRDDPLTIFGPSVLTRWFSSCSKYTTSVEHMFKLKPHHLLYSCFKSNPQSNILHEARKLLGLSEIVMVPVSHSYMAFGISMQHEDGWKLVYSGDTLPSKLLAHHGRNCDILIHEGTFDGSEGDTARVKRHSTIDDAIQAGRDMNAKFTLITHFSQKYCKVPILPKEHTENVGFAFDLMQVRPSQLWMIPLIMPVIDSIFGHNEANVIRTMRYKASVPKTMFKQDFGELVEEDNQQNFSSKDETKEAERHFNLFYFNK